jgi:spore germination protein YaaH
VMRHDLSGVDIDFERISAWSEQDLIRFTRFLRVLGNRLRRGKKLGLCCPTWHFDPRTGDTPFPWHYPELAKLDIDYYSAMA